MFARVSHVSFSLVILFALLCGVAASAGAQQQPRSPSDTVREFYKALREKRFRDAFALSIYKSAIDPLKPKEFDELRPEFERIAGVIPAEVNLGGEQISGDLATVF